MDNMDNMNNTESPNSEVIESGEKAPKKSAFLKKLLSPSVFVPIIAAVALVIVGAFAVSANTDKSVTNSAMNDLIERIENIDALTALSKAYEDGKIEISAGENSELVDTPFDLSIWSESRTGKNVAKVDIGGEGGTLYSSEKGLYLKLSMLDDVYGVEYDGIAKKIEESELLDEILGSTGMDADTIKESLTNIASDVEKAQDDGEKYAKKYAELLKNKFWEYAEKESENESGSRVVTLTLDDETIGEILEDLFETAAKDKNFIEYLDDNFGFGYVTGTYSEYDSWKEFFTDEDVIDYIEDGLSEMSFKLKVEITASSMMHNMKMLKASVYFGEMRYVLLLDMTEDDTFIIKTSRVYSGETEVLAKLTYTKTEDGFTAKAQYGACVTFDVKYKLNDGKCKLTVERNIDGDGDGESNDYVNVTVDGKYENDSKHFLLTVDEMTINEDTEVCDLSLECVYGESMPEFPDDYVDLLSLDESDFANIGSGLSKWFGFSTDDEFDIPDWFGSSTDDEFDISDWFGSSTDDEFDIPDDFFDIYY